MSKSGTNLPYYTPGPNAPASPSSAKPLLADVDMPPSPVRPSNSNVNSNPNVPFPSAQSQDQAHVPPNIQQAQGQAHASPTNRPAFWPSSGWNPAYSPGVGQSLPGANKARAAPAVVSSCNVIPVPLLGRWPAMVHCPACDNLGLTEVRYSVGMGTHALAALLLFTTGIGVVLPYIAPQCKDVEHSCGGCKNVLATCWFLGGTEAHLF